MEVTLWPICMKTKTRFSSELSYNPWQIERSAYNNHSLVHSQDLVPWQIVENWEVSSQRHKPVGFAVWRADVAKDKRHRCFRLLISWQAKAARVKSSPLCYQNFNNWIVIGSNNSVDPVNITLNKHSQEWKIFWGEFDPGSGWTLAACLIHASRTRCFCSNTRVS